MGGLLLPFPPRIPAPRFSLKMIHGDLGIAPEWRFSPQPKTCTEICAAPSDPGLLIDPS
jgi:hypothetical protein